MVLLDSIIAALDDLKAQNTVVMDVIPISDVMDTLVIASGTSTRHVASLARKLVEALKQKGVSPLGIEGIKAADWVLVDYDSVVVHIMLPETRDFYELEKLWSSMNKSS